MPSRFVLLLSLASLILFSALITPALSKTPAADEDDEDLSFLEEDDDGASKHASPDHHFDEIDGEDDFSDQEDSYDDFDASSNFDQPDGGYEEDQLGADEKDVVVLGGGNFTDFIKSNKYVMVEFYAPWCGHCMSLAPEYAAAATELKDGVKNETVSLVKVDATEESDLAEQYEVQGFPTVLFFIDGEHKTYNGARSKDAIVTWIKKKIGPGVTNVTTVDDAERILTSEDKLVLGFFDSLVGPESDEFAAASKLDDDVNFYQTDNAAVAKLFHIESDAKRPALVMLKKEAEKVTPFDGEFTKSVIVEFITANKLPLVITFTRENAPQIFESSIKKQLLLFANSSESEKFVPIFQEAAKLFKGKLVFVNVELDNEDTGKPVAEYFGVEGEGPTVLGFTGTDDAKKYILDKEFNLENIKAFAADFVEDKLKPFYKSDPVPETNDGDVKIIVGNNFDEIVLDESKDVLLEIYAPWCGHCQSLEPTYNKLAKHLQPIESLVIAKMDGTTNEHPRVKAEGFPTLLFFPAGKKSSDPITVEADRTVVAMYKFLKKHATVPFKLQKPAVTHTTSEVSDATEGAKSSPDEVKDEL